VAGFSSRKAAQDYAEDLESDRRHGRWVETLDVVTRTEENYRSYLRNHIQPRWQHAALGAITALAVAVWMKDLRRHLAASTAAGIVTVFSMMLDDAVDERLIPTSPVHRRRLRADLADLPTERLHHLLRHAEITLAVTQPGLTETLPVPSVEVDEGFLTGDEPPIRWERGPTDLAYIIYTSGSTGLPKGVMINHRGAVNTILDINHRWNVGPADRVFALSSLGFDLSVYDIFGTLAAGGAIVLPSPGTERSPWEWTDLLTEHGVTVWNSVPALMEMLVEYSAGRGLRLPESLRLVLMSGDWIPVTLPDRVRALSTPDITLIGMGGATEASIWSNFYPIGTVDPAWPSIPYGKPLSNQHFDVLDPALRPRPDWVPGELYIGGTGVAMGYWRDPDKTEHAFITHPATGQRLYRTGDLGRYLPDGNLEFLGREDFQVKINGFRVELGEIEAALHSHHDVTSAVVIATGNSHDTRRLVAYVTPAHAPVDTLRKYLCCKLPGYLVPERFTALDQFPLTPNGKVDRTALL
jgi:amino acid adenylation domain-containing protein